MCGGVHVQAETGLWELTLLLPPYWVPGSRFRSSGLVTNTLTCWTLLPTQGTISFWAGGGGGLPLYFHRMPCTTAFHLSRPSFHCYCRIWEFGFLIYLVAIIHLSIHTPWTHTHVSNTLSNIYAATCIHILEFTHPIYSDTHISRQTCMYPDSHMYKTGAHYFLSFTL